MVEGGNAEKFPDEWDIQFLGNMVASQLASGTPIDFLIKRYVFFFKLYFIFIAQSHYWSFQSLFKCKFLNNFSFRIFLSYQSRRALLETELGSTLELTDTCGCPPSDGSYPGASDPHCPYIRRREIVQFLV